jgi:glycosyltransferase involved in cell wall biosynthesis
MKLAVLVENDSSFVFEEVAALREAGLQVEVASVFRPSPASRWELHYGSPVDYPASGWSGWAARSLRDGAVAPLRIARIARTAREEGAPLRLVALAAGLARRARAEGWHHFHGSFAAFPAWTAWAAARLADLPFSFTGHAYDLQEPRPWLSRLMGEASFVRAISREGASRLGALVARSGDPDRVRVGYLGVDVERFRPGRTRAPGPPSVVSVARLGPTKGLEILIDAAAELARSARCFRVEILGDGPLRADLEARVRALGVEDRVRLEGPVSREGVARTLAGATVFALPCTVVGAGRHDGLPVAILEAMAAGLPVVTTPVGGIPEAIVSGKNGRLVQPGDSRALRLALAELLDDHALRARLGAAGRKTVLKRFQLRDSAARLAAWIAESASPPTVGRAASTSWRRVSKSHASRGVHP